MRKGCSTLARTLALVRFFLRCNLLVNHLLISGSPRGHILGMRCGLADRLTLPLIGSRRPTPCAHDHARGSANSVCFVRPHWPLLSTPNARCLPCCPPRCVPSSRNTTGCLCASDASPGRACRSRSWSTMVHVDNRRVHNRARANAEAAIFQVGSQLTASSMAPHRSCRSRRWRKFKMVVSSGAATARPRSTLANRRSLGRIIQRLFRTRVRQVEPQCWRK